MAPCKPEPPEDNLKLEPKVVLALSRLLKSKKSRSSTGVSCKQIVQYLVTNYCGLDGDIESQVMTALLSCVKTGIVCALQNGKYLLPVPGFKGIVTPCVARTTHGPKCSCLQTMKCMSRNFQKGCCFIKPTPSSGKRTKRPAAGSRSCSRQKKPPGSPRSRKCAQKAQKKLDLRNGPSLTVRFTGDVSKCNYCLETHAAEEASSYSLCGTCHPFKTGFVAPFDKFSPREEVEGST